MFSPMRPGAGPLTPELSENQRVVLHQVCSDLFQLQQETHSLGVNQVSAWEEASDDQDKSGPCPQGLTVGSREGPGQFGECQEDDSG